MPFFFFFFFFFWVKKSQGKGEVILFQVQGKLQVLEMTYIEFMDSDRVRNLSLGGYI